MINIIIHYLFICLFYLYVAHSSYQWTNMNMGATDHTKMYHLSIESNNFISPPPPLSNPQLPYRNLVNHWPCRTFLSIGCVPGTNTVLSSRTRDTISWCLLVWVVRMLGKIGVTNSVRSITTIDMIIIYYFKKIIIYDLKLLWTVCIYDKG